MYVRMYVCMHVCMFSISHPQQSTSVSHACDFRGMGSCLAAYTHIWVHTCTRTQNFTHASAYMHMKCLYASAFCAGVT